MAGQHQLNFEDREFCELVSAAAYCNPFSQLRADLDRKIIESATPIDPDERARRINAALATRLSRWEAAGNANIQRYKGEERDRMQAVLLFEIYHRFCNHFDQLIQRQIQTGDTPCHVLFAREALAAFTSRGFKESESLRFFAIFYQMRRAYFFIFHGLLGQSACMHELRRHLWNNVFTHDIRWYERHLWNRMEDFSTLLLGETGTGKGTAAAAIGRSGFIPYDPKKETFAESFTRSFVALNLSQFPESLIESELFGHKKGAFTGAVEAHEGIFSRCSSHGAIFLDEIGEVSVPIQIKLLQVLQERTFSPVGGHEKLRFRGRVIAATNKPLQSLRKEVFRDDFYYRLCSDTIVVPSLRQRISEDPGELDLLLRHLLSRMVGEESDDLIDIVTASLRRGVSVGYTWPGNVRELEQAIRRILVTQQYEGEESSSSQSLGNRIKATIDSGSMTADELLSAYCAMLYEKSNNYEEVARQLQLDRRTVRRYVQQYSSLGNS